MNELSPYFGLSKHSNRLAAGGRGCDDLEWKWVSIRGWNLEREARTLGVLPGARNWRISEGLRRVEAAESVRATGEKHG